MLKFITKIINDAVTRNAMNKQNQSRIKYLIELFISSKLDRDLLNLVIEYSMFDITLFEDLNKNEIYNIIWKNIENFYISSTIDNIIENIKYETKNNEILEEFKYTQIMNFLTSFHRYLADEYRKNHIPKKLYIENYLLGELKHVQISNYNQR